MVIGTYILITTLNVNGLNTPVKRHRLAEWIQNENLYICCLQETHFTHRDTYRLKVRDGKRYSMQMEIKRKLEKKFSHQIKYNLKKKTITRDKEGHYIMIKGSIQEEDRIIVNIYAPSKGAPQYIRQMLTPMKWEINSNTIIEGILTTHFHQWTDYPK